MSDAGDRSLGELVRMMEGFRTDMKEDLQEIKNQYANFVLNSVYRVEMTALRSDHNTAVNSFHNDLDQLEKHLDLRLNTIASSVKEIHQKQAAQDTANKQQRVAIIIAVIAALASVVAAVIGKL